MEAAARAQPSPAGPVYTRRQPEKSALYQVMQQHLLTFEQQWTDEASGRTLPKFVTDELHGYMNCGILGRGFAHLYCAGCREHHVVAFSCKARAVCPSCLGRRMSAGALTLVDHVLPDVPIRQFVFTVPFPLRFPLAFDGKLLGQVVRIFTDTVASWYRRRHAERGLPAGESSAVTVIHRANSDLRLNPHLHVLFLDGLYSPDRDGKGQMFHPSPAPTQENVEQLVQRASKRILRFLQRRGVITLVTAPGDDEVTVVGDEAMGEKDPLLARLLAAATTGAPPAGPATKRTRACPPNPCPTRLRRARRPSHRARPRRPPHRQGPVVRSGARVQLASGAACGRQRQAGAPHPVPLHPAPTPRQRPAAHPARRKRQAGLQEALVRWHLVGGP